MGKNVMELWVAVLPGDLEKIVKSDTSKRGKKIMLDWT